MPVFSERILLIENDPEISDLIVKQTLDPLGFRVTVVPAADQAIQEAMRLPPDVIVADLNLPGLSGKDLLVVLSSQGIETPVIVFGKPGKEADVVQAFRLGAADYLGWPAREAEVVTTLERVLQRAGAQRERALLANQLKQTNRELQRRVRELTILTAIGKAVTSITDQNALFEKLVEGAITIVEADRGWFLLREEGSRKLLLSAYRNLPPSAAAKFNQLWEDGLSKEALVSGESLCLHGEALKRYRIGIYGQAALVVPVKVKNEVVGLLVMIRKSAHPFRSSERALLEAVADYASISFVNARLFHALKDRAHSLQRVIETAQASERCQEDYFNNFDLQVRNPLLVAVCYLEMLIDEWVGTLNEDQRSSLGLVNEKLRAVVEVLESDQNPWIS